MNAEECVGRGSRRFFSTRVEAGRLLQRRKKRLMSRAGTAGQNSVEISSRRRGQKRQFDANSTLLRLGNGLLENNARFTPHLFRTVTLFYPRCPLFLPRQILDCFSLFRYPLPVDPPRAPFHWGFPALSSSFAHGKRDGSLGLNREGSW